MGSVFGRRRRRRYGRRHRSRRASIAALLVGSGFALVIGVAHLALARSAQEAELRSEIVGDAKSRPQLQSRLSILPIGNDQRCA